MDPMSPEEVRDLLSATLHGRLPEATIQRMMATLVEWMPPTDPDGIGPKVAAMIADIARIVADKSDGKIQIALADGKLVVGDAAVAERNDKDVMEALIDVGDWEGLAWFHIYGSEPVPHQDRAWRQGLPPHEIKAMVDLMDLLEAVHNVTLDEFRGPSMKRSRK